MNYIPLILVIVFLPYSYWKGYTPLLIGCTYLLVSLITIVFYTSDKRSAINDGQRVPENTLHLLALFCGWPGAIIAQQTLRHKTRKVSFRVVFWFTLLLNSAVLVWLHIIQGNSELHSFIFRSEALIFREIGAGVFRDTLMTLLGFRV